VSKSDLKIDWASHAAAKYACENWHYSQCLPVGKLVKVGAWENEKFIGVVLFGRGAGANISKPYNLTQEECCELVRIALTNHKSTVSRIMSLSIKFLKKQSSGMRLIVSYADPWQGHNGGIYQAGNWIYKGSSSPQADLIVEGKTYHKKSANMKFGSASPFEIKKKYGLNAEWSEKKWKHTYLMPLDEEMRQRILPLSKPYPKRTKEQEPENHSGLGGATPTRTLHSEALSNGR
jgi:hypothetical protein